MTSWSDFGKNATDLNKKIYTNDSTFKWSTGTECTGISFKSFSKGCCAPSQTGELDVKFKKLAWNSTLQFVANTQNNNVKTTITTTGPAPVDGLSFKFVCNPEKSDFNAQAKLARNDLRASLQFDLGDAKGVSLAASYPVKPVSGLLIGGSVGATFAKSEEGSATSLSKGEFGVQYTKDSTVVSCVVSEQLQKVRATVFNQVSDRISAAAEITRPTSKQAVNSYVLGGSYKIDDSSLFKAKIDNSGTLSTALETQLSPNVTLSLSTSVDNFCCKVSDSASSKSCAPRFGFGLTVA